MPIRTTRTSRLRAAAANNSDSSSLHRKSNRSSSVQSLVADSNSKSPKKSKIIDRDKNTSLNRKQCNEKENKNTFDRDFGAIKSKLTHSNNKNILEKDKSNLIVTNAIVKNVDENVKLDERKKGTNESSQEYSEEKIPLIQNGEEIFDEIEKDLTSSLDNDEIEDLFNNLIVDDVENENGIVELRINDRIPLDESGLKDGYNSSMSPTEKKSIDVNNIVLEDSVVPKVKEDKGGLLGAVCVRKVERFSELLSNLCSPCEADILFEDILAENGINGNSESVSF